MNAEELTRAIEKLTDRLHTLERLVWIAVGGTTIIGALVVWGVNFLAAKLKV